MSERKFKFVSPGVEIREIDRSQVGATPGARFLVAALETSGGQEIIPPPHMQVTQPRLTLETMVL